MNQVGELVLARNQVLQGITKLDDSALQATARSLDQVTSEIQESIMQTRMQPISSVFNKFPRIVRDLSRQLGKDIDLHIAGKETELDRTLLEAIRDPFTHLLRNSIDHGIETPEVRKSNGKKETGRLEVRAFHEGGQVIVEVQDDGAGINTEAVKAKALAAGLLDERQVAQMSHADLCMLICSPGLSTAQEVTNVSGRGVGMDVVKANIERIGGQLEIQSSRGSGTLIRIRIPLTLAIIPALMVGVGDRMVGIPQVNLVELVGLDVEQPNLGIDRINGNEVFRLRDRLLPIVRLRELMHVPVREESVDSVFLAVVAAGEQLFGVLVDVVFDTEEIVVKPLSAHLASLEHFAGATIRGDGRVCMILDVGGLGRMVGMREQHNSSATDVGGELDSDTEYVEMLLAHCGEGELFAVPVVAVERIEHINKNNLQKNGDNFVVAARGDLLPSVIIGEQEQFFAHMTDDTCFGLVVEGGRAGLLVNGITEILQVPVQRLRRCDGLACKNIADAIFNHEERLVVSVNVTKALLYLMPGLLGKEPVTSQATALLPNQQPTRAIESGVPAAEEPTDLRQQRILYAEDAQFFQRVVAELLIKHQYQVDVVSDGEQALAALTSNANAYDLLLSDLEMPVMDGWGLIRAVRDHTDWDHLPIIVLTSVNDDQLRRKSVQLGATHCLSKLDRDELLQTLTAVLNKQQAEGGVR